MQTMKFFKIIIVGLALHRGQAFANPPTFEQCIDPQSRFIIQKFLPSGVGGLGSMRFIDKFNRQVVDLFCGYDKNIAHRIEIACVSSHHGNSNLNTAIRVRVQRRALESLPQLALLEIQSQNQPLGTINEVLPMICK